MRKSYIDWLRNLGILYLFPFHTARIYDAFEPNYIKGSINLFSTNLVLLSFWFMPLLFMLSGMSSYYALKKRSIKEYIRERLLRLFIPFLFGLFIIVPPQAYLAEKFHNGYTGGYISYMKIYFTDYSDLSGYYGSFTPGHLWFILFLFIISLFLLPIMTIDIEKKKKISSLLKKPMSIILVFIAITLVSLLPNIGGKNVVGYYVLAHIQESALQFILIMIVSFISSLITYELLRRFKITKVLFGIKC